MDFHGVDGACVEKTCLSAIANEFLQDDGSKQIDESSVRRFGADPPISSCNCLFGNFCIDICFCVSFVDESCHRCLFVLFASDRSHH